MISLDDTSVRVQPEGTVLFPPVSLQTKDNWSRQVLGDRTLRASASKVAWSILTHLNRETGRSWPSTTTIAEEIGMTRRSVFNALNELVTASHLEIKHGGGRASNSYRLILKTAHVKRATPVQEAAAVQQAAPGDDAACTAPVKSRAATRETGCTQTPLEPQNEPLREPHYPSPSFGKSDRNQGLGFTDGKLKKLRLKKNDASTENQNADFEDWFNHYPRKMAKEAARKAYDRIIKAGKASTTELLTGVMRYAAERDAEISAGLSEPKYTKHPATWLNSGCWADEPTTSSPLLRTEKSNSHTQGAASAMNGIWRNIKRNEGG